MSLFWAHQADLEEASIRELRDPNEVPGGCHYDLVIEFTDVRSSNLSVKQKCVLLGTDPVSSLAELALAAVPTEPGTRLASLPNDDSSRRQLFPERPSSMVELIEEMRKSDIYKDQIKGMRTFPSRLAKLADLDTPLSCPLTNALRDSIKVQRLYSHQAQAINHIEQGHNVVVSTSTSSGKSLIYQLPVLRALERDPAARAIYIFPTKALAQDQKRALRAILTSTSHLAWVQVDTYDGDTPLKGGVRAEVRGGASIILTNPDMLHVGILPQHKYWKEFLEHLKFVIVDELHYYTATFGSHCAMIMRRLRRICEYYENRRVQFIACSATAANPSEIMTSFFGLANCHVVNIDGSPCGMKHHLVWNPPLKDENKPIQGRRSFLEEAVRVMLFLLMRGVRTIVFARVRRMCELVLKEAHAALRNVSPGLVPKIMGYRAGYSPGDRRQIESKLSRGELLCVVATNALELGVDIGSLDAVLHLGFPFSSASYWQQSGRVGRRERDSVSILLADGDNMLDQHYASKPNELFDSPFDATGIELNNSLVVEAHLQCAAAEIPIVIDRDAPYFGDMTAELCKKHLLKHHGGELFFAHRKYNGWPSRHVHIRSIDEETYRVIDVTTNSDIEDIEASRVPFTLYEGSIFIHQGRPYIVFEVNAELMFAKVRPTAVDYVTANRDFTDVDPMKTIETRAFGTDQLVHYGEFRGTRAGCIPPTLNATSRLILTLFSFGYPAEVTTIVFGYFKINPKSKQILEAVDGIENPPIVKTSFGFWIDVPVATVLYLKTHRHDVEYCIHAAAHAIISQLPGYVMIPTTGQTNIRTECKHPAATRMRPPRIVVYDFAGGGGMTFKAFKQCTEVVTKARDVVAACECAEGCPRCVQRASCKEGNAALDKLGGLIVLKGILGESLSSVQWGAPNG
ncbi:hypothetical protein HK104_003141 [Borealophlyctis nickersoniae]|nr:hypothetical protein HK104_003141 [Borealophlyctis nickersoniae]